MTKYDDANTKINISSVPDKVKPFFSLRTSVVGPAAVNWGAMGARFDIVNE